MVRRVASSAAAAAAALIALPAVASATGVVIQNGARDVTVSVVPASDTRGHAFVFETFFEGFDDRSLRVRQRLFGDPDINTSNCRDNAVLNDVVCPGIVDFGETNRIDVTGGAGGDHVEFGRTEPTPSGGFCSSSPALFQATLSLGPGADLFRTGPTPPDDTNCPAGFTRMYELDVTVFGGDGPDSLVTFGGGHVRVARLHGEDGADELQGAEEADHLTGGEDDDRLTGLEGDDLLEGNSGGDALNGHSGSDTMRGGSGGDELLGFSGTDVLEGGSAGDRLEGGDGDDTLRGGSGDDLLRGQGGDDLMSGETGSDEFSGGAGFNTVTYETATGPVVVTVNGPGGAPGPDGIVSGGVSEGDDVLGSVDAVIGGPFGDSLTGDDSGERLEGRAGGDFLRGGGGADVLLAADGDDAVRARDGVAEAADCGPGFDNAIIDLVDSAPGCELVARFAVDDGPPGRPAGPPRLRGSRALVAIRCPAAARVPCRGVLRLRSSGETGAEVLGSSRYAVPLGRRATVRIALGAPRAAIVRALRRVELSLVERGRSRKGPRSFTAILPVRR